MPCITSANVACGFHAGDAAVMRRDGRSWPASTAWRVGAHPALRIARISAAARCSCPPPRFEDLVMSPNRSARGGRCSRGHSAATRQAPRRAVQHGCSRSPGGRRNRARRRADRPIPDPVRPVRTRRSIAAGEAAGLRTACEAFADRAYRSDGTLVPRTEPGAVIHDPDGYLLAPSRWSRSRRDRRRWDASAGHVDTICVHGDTPGPRLAAHPRALVRMESRAGAGDVSAV